MIHDGFRQVEKAEFFKAVGPQNVTPYPQGRWANDIGYLSHWKTPSGAIMAVSDEAGEEGRYWLSVSWFPKSESAWAEIQEDVPPGMGRV